MKSAKRAVDDVDVLYLHAELLSGPMVNVNTDSCPLVVVTIARSSVRPLATVLRIRFRRIVRAIRYMYALTNRVSGALRSVPGVRTGVAGLLGKTRL